jgi:hypothetical protein
VTAFSVHSILAAEQGQKKKKKKEKKKKTKSNGANAHGNRLTRGTHKEVVQLGAKSELVLLVEDQTRSCAPLFDRVPLLAESFLFMQIFHLWGFIPARGEFECGFFLVNSRHTEIIQHARVTDSELNSAGCQSLRFQMMLAW